MISILQAVVIGLVQGLTELFPISSLGHSVIIPSLLGWNIHQNDPYFLTFLVATHLATAIVLLGFFWRDWVGIVKGLARSFAAREIRADDTQAKLGWLLVLASVPAGILGLLLPKSCASVPTAAKVSRKAMPVSRVCAGGKRLALAWPRLALCFRASRAPVPRWPAGLLPGSTTKTLPASVFCWQRQLLVRRRCSKSPNCSSLRPPQSVCRSLSVPFALGLRPSYRCGF